jgi:hypothetical protein
MKLFNTKRKMRGKSAHPFTNRKSSVEEGVWFIEIEILAKTIYLKAINT